MKEKGGANGNSELSTYSRWLFYVLLTIIQGRTFNEFEMIKVISDNSMHIENGMTNVCV